MPSEPGLTKGIVIRFAQLMVQLVVTGALMLGCAGSVGWWPAWLYLGSMLAMMTGLGFWVFPRNPLVIAERGRLHKDTASFDKVIIPIHTLVSAAVYVVGALDGGRFHWAPLSWWWSLVGVGLLLLGTVPTAGAMGVNKRLATTVRVEKGQHELATTGPYAVVRHPMYAGMMLQLPATALILGSTWALVPAAVGMVVLVVRTALEDQHLHRELPGYVEYARKTKYRLLPGVW